MAFKDKKGGKKKQPEKCTELKKGDQCVLTEIVQVMKLLFK